MRSPIKWYGGKAQLADVIVSLMPPHGTYVELFGGGGSVLFAKPQVKVEVYNDLNSEVVNLMRVLRDPELSRRLADQLRLTPYAREEHECCRRLKDTVADEVERARCFVVRVRQSRNGQVDVSWRYDRSGGDVGPFVNCVDLIAPVCERLQGVRIENRDFGRLIDTWDGTQTLIYADPPYVGSTRVAPKAYQHELSDEDHQRLLDQLVRAKSMVILSGYQCGLYENRLADWQWIDVATKCSSSPSEQPGKRSKPDRVEAIWLNAAAREALSVSQAEADQTPTCAAKMSSRRRRRRGRKAASTTQVPKARGGTHLAALMTSGRQDWATPLRLFEELDSEFGFDLDVCVNASNAKCESFLAVEDDGLGQDWGSRTCWMNPPYGRDIGAWIEKAFKSSRCGASVVCLVPARTDTRWWQTWATKADEVRYLPGRVKFVHPDGRPGDAAPFPSAVVVFRRRRLGQDIFGDEREDLRCLWGDNGRRLAPWLY